MVAARWKPAWMNVVLTTLVALALLLAPAAGAQAMPCHDHTDHGQHSGVDHSSVLKDMRALFRGGSHTPDHKSCCAVQCAFCIVLTNIVRTGAPALMGSFLRFAWSDQTGRGLALPPTLGPPRLPV